MQRKPHFYWALYSGFGHPGFVGSEPIPTRKIGMLQGVREKMDLDSGQFGLVSSGYDTLTGHRS